MVTNKSLSKPASQWQFRELRELADAHPQESLYLEFKKPGEFLASGGTFSGDKLAKELAETASAFLNSDGGIILLGVQTTPVGTRTEQLKPLNQWDDESTFETLAISLTPTQVLDRVNSNLAPPPFGIEAQAVDVPLANGKKTTIFVVSVPSSVTAAHQSTRSLRYYKRIHDADKPMLDYEIRDVNNRRTGPLLLLEVHLSDLAGRPIRRMPEENGSWVTAEERRFVLVLTTRNVGRATAPVARFDIGIPSGWEKVDPVTEWFKVTPFEQQMYGSVAVFMRSGISRTVPRGQRVEKVVKQETTWYGRRWPISDTEDHPLWSSETIVPLGTVRLQMPSSIGEDVWMPWRVMAEGMPDTRGAAFFKRKYDNDLKVINFALNDVDWAVVGGAEAEQQRFDYLHDKYVG